MTSRTDNPPTGKKKRRVRNREYTIVTVIFTCLFLALAGYLIYFNQRLSDSFINSPYNTRQNSAADRIVRGDIISSDGEVLATTNVYEDGSEERIYPYSNIFAHVVGYNIKGKFGLEKDTNFSLLSTHSFFLNQLKNEFQGYKSVGDTVQTTLNAQMQVAAYNALGSYNGAVIAIEPSTGKILCMVSKPDFDPNTLSSDWDAINSDENSSVLLNRVTGGAYPPGSTFKLVTALAYYRANGNLDHYSYDCTGTITMQDHTIRCYNSNVHGQEDFYSAFANSCNCAFAEIGTVLGGDALKNTAENLLFNKSLPYSSSAKSSFSLNDRSGTPLIMQTSIGQGNTLVSPLHMALIVSAAANEGVLMKPYLVDKILTDAGSVVTTTKPEKYKSILSIRESQILCNLMEDVVQYGTASALSGRSYTAAGKTGSAEYNASGASHSWFVGYCGKDGKNDLAVAIIVEEGGTGSEAAVPIAATLFDTYYNYYG